MSLPAELKAAYRDAPRQERLHVAGRWRTCPFAAVEPHVPKAGRIMEIGCGHGLFSLYLALQSPERSVTGVDVDADKIPVARRAAERAIRLRCASSSQGCRARRCIVSNTPSPRSTPRSSARRMGVSAGTTPRISATWL